MKLWICAAAGLAAVAFTMAPAKKCTQATAVVHPAKGQAVGGVVKFDAVDGGVKISWELTGLAPGKHGFHIHELGDCNCDDLKCAGGHFNPEGKKHGGPSSPDRHVGDLGNVEAGADGTSKGETTDKMIALSGDHSIVGRSVILHEKADDLATEPAGNAGNRIASGVVGIKKEE
jgi:Cu-Zn family superoxide dismutase